MRVHVCVWTRTRDHPNPSTPLAPLYLPPPYVISPFLPRTAPPLPSPPPSPSRHVHPPLSLPLTSCAPSPPPPHVMRTLPPSPSRHAHPPLSLTQLGHILQVGDSLVHKVYFRLSLLFGGLNRLAQGTTHLGAAAQQLGSPITCQRR